MAVKKSTKKAAAKKTAAAPKRKTPAIQKKFTKTEILNEISANTELSKKRSCFSIGRTGNSNRTSREEARCW